MSAMFEIGDVVLTQAPAKDRATGLLAYASFTLDRVLQVDGIAVRRTRDGRLSLSWPNRTDSRGRRHPILRPRNDVARVEIERAFIAAVGVLPE